MDDPVVLQLRQTLSAQGAGVLDNRAQLERALASVAASFPGKVKALLILLDKKAVTFLTGWANDARPDRTSYEQLRQQIAAKFEQAKLLNAAAASWAVDAWAEALELRDGTVAPAVPGAAASGPATPPPPAASGLALVEQPKAVGPRETTPTTAAPVASTAARSVASAEGQPSAARSNVYAPPAAHVEDPSEGGDDGAFIEGGRKLPAGRGWSWFAAAWGLFKASPLIWIVNFVLFAVIMIAVQLVPIAGGIIGILIAPVLGAGLMLGARAVDRGDDLEVGHLFAGFRQRTGTLVKVGVLYLLGTLVMVLAMVLVMGVGVLGALGGQAGAVVGAGLLLGVLVALALSVPLMMAYWFAPALVVFNGLGAVQAMKTSFSACLKNLLPFLVYGLIGLLLAVLASIPIALGWFVLGPVLLGSQYTSYRDIFYDD
jgi:uncharacterized membrane protein